MNKQKESVDEKALGRIVAGKLREQLKGVSVGCPDTETLAAFYDRTLTDREHKVWEEHLLTCLHCQGYMAELARLSEVDEPQNLVEVEPSAMQEAKPSWTFRLAWVAPFLIVAIGSAVWFRDDIRRMLPRQEEIAQNEPEPVPVPEPPAATRDRDVGASREAAQASAEDKKTLAKAALPAPRRTAEEAQARPAATAVAGAAKEGETPTGVMAPLSERAELRAAAKPADRVLAVPLADRKDQAAGRAAEPAAVAPAMKAQTAEAASGFARQSSQLRGVTVQGEAPRFAPQWRVGRGGLIQKADGAGGWVNVPSGVDSDLFDITFHGTTGWAVGYEGTVLRSTDGGDTWHKVTSPSSEDLVRVSAAGARQARVISRSGQSFSTSDGGKTWQATAQD